MAAGATRLYIYDDEMGEAYWPNTFVELHKVCLPQGEPGHRARYSVRLCAPRRPGRHKLAKMKAARAI
jgi:hypothetical protein